MFQKNFLMGFSISGFQSEMGLGPVDNKSDWWKWVHDEDNIKTGLVSGDLPENGIGYWDRYEVYNKHASDFGANVLRLGLEWTRLFPDAAKNVEVEVSEDGGDIIKVNVTKKVLEEMDKIVEKSALEHYMKVFHNVKENGMKLIVNAYHWPLPLELHDPIASRKSGLGNKDNGWLNHSTVIEFVKYAAYVSWKFEAIADQFSIMNEPNVVYGNGYVNVKSGFPPAYPSVEAGNLCKKHIIEAIGRSYDEMKKYTVKPVGLIYANADFVPQGGDDEKAVEEALYDNRYSFFDSLIFGDMKWVNTVSESENFREDSNPSRPDLKGKLDWIGVNYYTRHVIKAKQNGYSVLSGYGHNATSGMLSKAGRDVSDFGWECYPEGLYNVLKQYSDHYKLPLIVTENGIADSMDRIRPKYLVSHISQIERAIEDGIDVRGYLHWSLLDNYEWSSGFSFKFGIFGVNLKDKSIIMRPSALIYKMIAENSGIPESLKWMSV